MESLADTEWDVVISGTGLAQSLLALALSRSGKKILHVDRYPYYGSAEAALSLQEAEEWAEKLSREPGVAPFEDVSFYNTHSLPETVGSRLSFSRAYTLSLSPHLVYTRSELLACLVSSKAYRQLEFQAVGSWWIYKPSTGAEGNISSSGDLRQLYRVPSSREDVFADQQIPIQSKRKLVKFLRHVSQTSQGDSDDTSLNVKDDLELPFPEYLTSAFQIPPELHDPLLALSLAQSPPKRVSARFAVPRIQRHLTSIGVFGPGFSSLLAKWGGGSEVAQVACRALAVGGGVYALNKEIMSIDVSKDGMRKDTYCRIQLPGGESIRSEFVVGSQWDLPADVLGPRPTYNRVARCITIVSSSLRSLFPPTSDGGPTPAGAVVIFPGTALSDAQGGTDPPPTYLLVHSNETGECPAGQCVIYGTTSLPGSEGQSLLETAVTKLLEAFAGADGNPAILWSLRFTQLGLDCEDSYASTVYRSPMSDRIICFPPPSLDIAVDDKIVDSVNAAWRVLTGNHVPDVDFMNFNDRVDLDMDD